MVSETILAFQPLRHRSIDAYHFCAVRFPASYSMNGS